MHPTPTAHRPAADPHGLIQAHRAAAARAHLPTRTPAQQDFLERAHRAQQAQRFAPADA